MRPEQLTVVYHACLGPGWPYAGLIAEQLDHLAGVGLRNVLCTHLGENRQWLQEEAWKRGINLLIVSSDPNIAHYETHAMLLMERLSRCNDGAVLYLHTKGISVIHSDLHRRWRKLMHIWVVEKWRENLASLADHDVCGVGWGYNFTRPHFPGNFWLARWDWIRKLPDFTAYHHAWQLQRFSCEAWIGATPNPRVVSHCTINEPWDVLVQRYMQ